VKENFDTLPLLSHLSIHLDQMKSFCRWWQHIPLKCWSKLIILQSVRTKIASF